MEIEDSQFSSATELDLEIHYNSTRLHELQQAYSNKMASGESGKTKHMMALKEERQRLCAKLIILTSLKCTWDWGSDSERTGT